MTDYRKIYDALILKRRVSPPAHGEYKEIHHIVPRCMGGTDAITNLVALTAREHFIAHQLLAKIYGGWLLHAAWRMSNMKRYGARRYAWLRECHADFMSQKMTGVPKSAATVQKMRGNKNALGNRFKQTREAVDKVRRAMAGNQNGKGLIGYKRTPEHCANIAASKRGRVLTVEQKAKIRNGVLRSLEANRGRI